MTHILLLTSLLLLGAATAAGAVPDGWAFSSPRPEIAPKSLVVPDAAGYSLLLSGGGNSAADGKWSRRVPVTPGQPVAFTARCRTANIPEPHRSVMAKVLWLDESGKQVEQAEFPTASPTARADGWRTLAANYVVPAKARQAQLELHLRWAPDGQVEWRDAALAATSAAAAAPTTRNVKVASVHHRPRGAKSPRENLEQFAKHIEAAGQTGADIVCLPEGTTVCGTGLKVPDVAEPIPGPSTEFLGQLAARHKCYVVAGIYERDGKVIYNTSVLLDRAGTLVGRYRKVCLPREEVEAGITPGTTYPVFDTDFGRIGMMICWDLSYPEVARRLAANGAEIIFMPICGGNGIFARARAIENQVHIVASGYDFRTAIYDKTGADLARAPDDRPHVIYATIDLNHRQMWPWLGDWRSRIWLESPPGAKRPE